MNASLDKISRSGSSAVPPLILFLAVFFIFCMPLRIAGYGYLPQDDALRHSAKVVSGKDWNAVLVLRDDVKMDSHPGWHYVLGAVRKAANWPPYGLAVFSVVSLFLLVAVPPLFLINRPEAWALALLLLALVDPGIFYRLLIGRPFLATTAYVIAFAFAWRRLKAPGCAAFAAVALGAALATWIHCAWYLLALPCAALFLASEWRAGAFLAAGELAGVAAGAVLTGHPVQFLVQTARHFFLSLGDAPQYALVGEFQPSSGDFSFILFFPLFLLWRLIGGRRDPEAARNPVLMLAALCWALGFLVGRVWSDIGLAAGLVWIAQETEQLLESGQGYYSYKRLAFSAAVLAVLFLAVTNDGRGRWSLYKPALDVTPATVKDLSWLPGAGGVVYSDDMGVFYDMFFRNPRANWRYILGFEPALMPKEDLAVYRDIAVKRGAKEAYAPWVAKMKPADRMIFKGTAQARPGIEGLEWKFIAGGAWSGRLPREKAGRRAGSPLRRFPG